jgi:hypothetical protein
MKSIGLYLNDKGAVAVAAYDTLSGKYTSASLEIDHSFPDRLGAFVERSAGGSDVVGGLELYRTPIDTFPEVMHLLHGIGKLGVADVKVSRDQRKLLIGDIPQEFRAAYQGQKDIRLIFPGIARSLFHLREQREATDLEVAETIAMICGVTGRYRFCRSVGIVQSAADVAVFLHHPPERGSGVISSNDWYHMVRADGPLADFSRGDVFLTYELGKKQYSYLHEGNALKMGLLSTCKAYDIRLYCGSLEGNEGETYQKLMQSGDKALTSEFRVWPQS